MYDEGVIKFSSEHETRELSRRVYGGIAGQLIAWRQLLSKTGQIGQVADRYGGAGFGNLSARVNPPSLERGRRKFLISGTQTGGVPSFGLEHFCVVNRYNLGKNSVESFGAVLPSSESLTHAAIYDLTPHIRFVFHGHSPVIWKAAKRLRLPTTDESVAYGTQEMAREVQRLFQSGSLPERRVLSMAGHEDGIIAFGHTAKETGLALLAELAAAYEFS